MNQELMERTHAEVGEGEPGRKNRPSYLLVVVLLVLFTAAAIVGLFVRFGESRALAKETEILAVPNVVAIHPKPEAPQQEIVLPSTLQAFTESAIHARTDGYLARWYRDIGSKVQKGQLLADIETPEIDQELQQARALREQAAAQVNLAKTSAERWETLRKMDAVAQQETDERSSSYTQGQAALASATANVRRLEQLESFKHIYAPFSGVIIRRNTDVGQLINAGNNGASQELFAIAQVNPIRVYIDVPELYAPTVKIGLPASIELPSLPGQKFTGKVARTSDALDPATRTLRTEIDVPNPNGQLLPGSYAQVHFAVQIQSVPLTVPVNALLFRGEGTRAAVVGSDGKVQLKPVVIGRDYGTEVEILSGLQLSDSIILNPSDSLEEGQQVNVAPGKS